MNISELKDPKDRAHCERAEKTLRHTAQPDGRPTNLCTRDGQMPHLYTNWCGNCLQYRSQDHPQPCDEPKMTLLSLAKKYMEEAC